MRFFARAAANLTGSLNDRRPTMILDRIDSPADLRGLSPAELLELSAEIRTFIVDTVTATGGHLGSNLGVVEVTLAVHRIFDSPRDVILWDTGHQAYVHKLVTGRREEFARLRQAGGLSGYPNRGESEHDWVEDSHASTILSYAHGMASSFELQGSDRRVVAVVGDGALTGGMAYEALNNLGHSGKRVLVVLNDNGRSYAPTISRLSVSLTHLRLNPSYVQARERIRGLLRDIPGLGDLAYSSVHGLTSALREVVTPHTFFEALGIRYAGPIDGHDIGGVEQALANASEWPGPIVVHVLTQKGRGYAPAEEDDVQRLHDFKVKAAATDLEPDGTGDVTTNRVAVGVGKAIGAGLGSAGAADDDSKDAEGDDAAAVADLAVAAEILPTTYTDAFTRALLRAAETDPRLVAITAAMPGPTGLLPFQARFPDRFFDVGIAEQHAVTAAAGMAMAGLRPVVAVYSTFFSRAFDQANLDVGLHRLPVVLVLDRAGLTGEDGPSHHGMLDMVQALSIPGLTLFAPSSAREVEVMLEEALRLEGPSIIRFPKTLPPRCAPSDVGAGMAARQVRRGEGRVCLVAVGKMLGPATVAADLLSAAGVTPTLWDPRVISDPDPVLLEDMADHDLVVTVEDGVRHGGAGMYLLDAMRRMQGTAAAAGPAAVVLGLPRAYLAQGKADDILSSLGLDGPGIAASVQAALETGDDGVLAHPSRLVSPDPVD
ncbi:MAG: 1-deoxy-D-xylulose-5-phosphate synthase [Acidimicrobiales bacterium]|nr:1-deoxy-D-xylulose-5-phosphate synthase [Acidimicrobiales bacterium]